ncbi:MAG: RHS repeat-associated core domain-containing protein [Gemmatimonadota bacterium]
MTTRVVLLGDVSAETCCSPPPSEHGSSRKRNRYYDPSRGQFTQQDPIGIAAGLNLYGYADGDPINFSDPFGLKGCDVDNDEPCPVFFFGPDCPPRLQPCAG